MKFRPSILYTILTLVLAIFMSLAFTGTASFVAFLCGGSPIHEQVQQWTFLLMILVFWGVLLCIPEDTEI